MRVRSAAVRAIDATRLTIAQLAKTPGVGSPYPVSNPRLTGLRKKKESKVLKNISSSIFKEMIYFQWCE